MRGHMKRVLVILALAAVLLAMMGGAQADLSGECPAVVGNGRRLIREEHMARWSQCIYGPPTGDVCGDNALGWDGEVLRRNGRRVVCVFAEPFIPEINGGAGQ
jgi:hypothetical protein